MPALVEFCVLVPEEVSLAVDYLAVANDDAVRAAMLLAELV